jgi:mitochondrial fission protein ELM1
MLSTQHSSTAFSFSRETPTRFKKELAKVISRNGTVEVTQLNHFLLNIGRPDTLVSDAEFKNLLEEAGSTSRNIDTIAMLRRLVQ